VSTGYCLNLDLVSGAHTLRARKNVSRCPAKPVLPGVPERAVPAVVMRAFYAAGITRDRTPENPAVWGRGLFFNRQCYACGF
jgi:hypothetical protein